MERDPPWWSEIRPEGARANQSMRAIRGGRDGKKEKWLHSDGISERECAAHFADLYCLSCRRNSVSGGGRAGAEIWVRTRLLKSGAGFLPWFSKLNCLVGCLSAELLKKSTQPPFSLYPILAAWTELLKISSQPQTAPTQFLEWSWLTNNNNSWAIYFLLISLLITETQCITSKCIAIIPLPGAKRCRREEGRCQICITIRHSGEPPTHILCHTLTNRHSLPHLLF